MSIIELDTESSSEFSDSDYEVVDNIISINNIVYLGLIIFLFYHKLEVSATVILRRDLYLQHSLTSNRYNIAKRAHL